MHNASVIKALLVGINSYPKYPLSGCENDVNNLHYFLESVCDQSMQLDSKVLLNEEATRENLIQIFLEHFSSLKEGDIPLFYFSGHGAYSTAPKEFWHNTPNKQMESLVCYFDSLDEIFCLADKELSYLIWEVTKKYDDIPFTIIIDSCYSEGIVRWSNEIKIRRADVARKNRHWKTFLGAEHYYENAGNVTVPSGRYLLLSACRSQEVATEKYIDMRPQGVFTHSLINTLTKANGNITFFELKRLIQTQVYNLTFEQHPQISFSDAADLNSFFLGGMLQKKPVRHILFYNKNSKTGLPLGWLVDVGLIHGIEPGHTARPGKLLVYKNERSNPGWDNPQNAIAELCLNVVLPTHSSINAPVKLDIDEQYITTFSQLPSRALKVACHPSMNRGAKRILLDAWPVFSSGNLQMTDVWAHAQYLIHAKENQYIVTVRGEEDPVFKCLKGYTKLMACNAFENLERIGQWLRIKGLINPFSTIETGKIEIEFFEVQEATPDFMDAIRQRSVTDFLGSEPTLNYIRSSKTQKALREEIEPMFRLKIKNPQLSAEPLWISTLYLGYNYSIKNELMPCQLLSPGEEAWLEYFDLEKKKYSTLIPLHIEDTFLNNGVTEITEHFKIIFCTQEFDTSTLNQKGLTLATIDLRDRKGVGRKIVNFKPPIADWFCVDFAVRVKAINL